MTDKPKVGDAIDGKEVTGVFYPWVKFGDEIGTGWVIIDDACVDEWMKRYELTKKVFGLVGHD